MGISIRKLTWILYMEGTASKIHDMDIQGTVPKIHVIDFRTSIPNIMVKH